MYSLRPRYKQRAGYLIKTNMPFRLKLKEAIARAEMHGATIKKSELASKLWPNSAQRTLTVNMGNLMRGTTKTVSPEWVVIICETLNCSADFLFGLEEANDER